MAWSDPDKWWSVPIIATMLGFFWSGISKKKQAIDKSLEGYVDKTYCKMTQANAKTKQENLTLRLEATIRTEIEALKDEILERMRAIERAMKQ